ncbi:MAG: hypothetical protein WKF51_11265 [Geodermatophilaceae bacterium]
MSATQSSGPAALSAETRQPGTVRANRILLAALGVLLLGVGVLALLAGFGAFGQRLRLQFVLAPSIEQFVAASPWYWSVVAVVAAVVALLCLWWLLIQTRSDRVSAIRVSEDRTAGSTFLDAGAFTSALEAEIGTYRGVSRVGAYLSGTPNRYRATVRVALDGRIDAGEIHDRIVGQALPMARNALSVTELPFRLEFELPKSTTRNIR